MLLLIGCSSTTQADPQAPTPDVVTEPQAEIEDTTAQEDPQAFPPEVVAEIQTEMDALTAGELPPGMAVWIDAPAYRTQIYEPLGMTSTFLDCYEEPVIDVVHGYSGAGDEMADVTELHESVWWSAGGLVSTAPDLIAFARGLFGGALFDNPASLDAMTTAAPGSSYGLGVTIQEAYMGHAGYIAGFRSVLNYAPESDTVMVMLYHNDTADPEQGLTDVLSPALSMLNVSE